MGVEVIEDDAGTERRRAKWREANHRLYHSNPEYRLKQLANNRTYLASKKADPAWVEIERERGRIKGQRRYQQRKDDPVFQAANRARVKAWRDARRNDPAWVAKWREQRRNHPFDPKYGRDWRYGDGAGNHYIAQVEVQGGVCAICKLPPSTKTLQLDHNHATNQFRGALCENCNRGLGLFKEDRSLLTAAMAYLEKWDAYSS